MYRIANFSLGGPHLRNRLGQATGRQSKPTSGPPIDDTLYANSSSSLISCSLMEASALSASQA